MKIAGLVVVAFAYCVLGQSVLWEKSIPLDELGSYYIKNIDASDDGRVYIGIQDDPLKSSKWSYGDSKVIGIDLDGNVILEKNYGGIFDEGFSGVATKNDGFYFAGNSDSYNSNSKTAFYSADLHGNIMDSAEFEYVWATYLTKKIKKTKSNGFIHLYSEAEGYPDSYNCDHITVRDSSFAVLSEFYYRHDGLKENSFGALPDSIVNYFLGIDSHLPSESGVFDFTQTDNGMLFSGTLGGWTNSILFNYIRFVSNDEGVVWEKYYPHYHPEYFPDGRMVFFRDLFLNADKNSFIATVWRDEDFDYREDEGELYIAEMDLGTGEFIWMNSISKRPDQIIEYGDGLLIRSGINVSMVKTNQFGFETEWETDYENTGMISVVDGGYVSVVSTGDQLTAFRYYSSTGIEDASVPVSTELFQNYPNPFNPEAVIKYSLSKDAQVKLTVFDIAGREVASLVNQNQDKGNHSVNFNADGLNSGIYFYRLSVDGKAVQSRKMMMLK